MSFQVPQNCHTSELDQGRTYPNPCNVCIWPEPLRLWPRGTTLKLRPGPGDPS